MPSTSTPVDIMGLALDLLNEEPIVNPDDDRAAVRWMNRNFAPTRDAMLRAHPWNFAIKRAAVAENAVKPAFGWQRQYALPVDCLRLLPLTQSGARDGRRVPFELEGDLILTDAAAPLRLRYIGRIEDTTRFDPGFVQALAGSLAAKAAHYLTGKTSFAERAQAMAERAMAEARLTDALENDFEEAYGHAWEDGRFTGVIP